MLFARRQEFGGEGTGLKSWNFKLGWKPDTWYTLASRCWPVGDHTFYGLWTRSGETKQWTHLVTMDVAAKDAYFKGGTDAFLEDWSETGVKPRTTHLTATGSFGFRTMKFSSPTRWQHGATT